MACGITVQESRWALDCYGMRGINLQVLQDDVGGFRGLPGGLGKNMAAGIHIHRAIPLRSWRRRGRTDAPWQVEGLTRRGSKIRMGAQRRSNRRGRSRGGSELVSRLQGCREGVVQRIVTKKSGIRALQATETTNGDRETRGLYDDFVDLAVRKVGQYDDLSPFPFQDAFQNMVPLTGQSLIKNVAYESTKIRLFRVASIDGGDAMQVLNVAICARPEYDLPIFCADFFSTASRNIIVLDLNPIHNIKQNPQYRDKYYSQLLPLVPKYAELLPWGDKLTAESLQFFSPIVIWTRPNRREDIQQTVFSAFQDYLTAWLALLENAQAAVDQEEITRNQEAHHRYLMWRATKDPGRNILLRLLGSAYARYINEFLFNGVTTLGTKNFLDYFPEYRGPDGSISKQQSMVGKSYAQRPWDEKGLFILNAKDEENSDQLPSPLKPPPSML